MRLEVLCEGIKVGFVIEIPLMNCFKKLILGLTSKCSKSDSFLSSSLHIILMNHVLSNINLFSEFLKLLDNLN